MCFISKKESSAHVKGKPRDWKEHMNILLNYDPKFRLKKHEEFKERGIKLYHQVEIHSFNPITDTPIDVLHTLYLGCCKKFIECLMKELPRTQTDDICTFFKETPNYKCKIF